MYDLYIANKNYSSWSLRPWVLMSELHIPFHERLESFQGADNWSRFRRFSPTGKVPTLIVSNPSEERRAEKGLVIWDSLAIAEFLAERHAGVWPEDPAARAWARCAAAEMHSGFPQLRANCSMNCGIRVKLNSVGPQLQRELVRLDELWDDGLDRFGGPFLTGTGFTAVDAFYAPVAFRVQSYGLEMVQKAREYVDLLLGLESMQSWYEAALREEWRDESHEREWRAIGTLVDDLRRSTR
ncbi:MAG: glutathione S-transferase family protein [Acidobacteria bacterium]|nr:MAG: glutathione S-transferase family protein [Acidobacteriota bacterium]REK08871.1 MAG: glutathione S-transferase family protein [Acidobacteriota bacterium]